MIPRIHIMTRHTCESADSLRRCGESIRQTPVDHDWFIIGSDPSAASDLPDSHYLTCPTKPERDWGLLPNHYLETIADAGQWLYLLDADNLLHPGFAKWPGLIDPDCQLVVFSQQIDPAHIRLARPDKLWVQHVDAAQFCVKRSFIGDLRMWNIYRNDGYFLMELAIRAREQGVKVQVFAEVMSYYNAQRWL